MFHLHTATIQKSEISPRTLLPPALTKEVTKPLIVLPWSEQTWLDGKEKGKGFASATCIVLKRAVLNPFRINWIVTHNSSYSWYRTKRSLDLPGAGPAEKEPPPPTPGPRVTRFYCKVQDAWSRQKTTPLNISSDGLWTNHQAPSKFFKTADLTNFSFRSYLQALPCKPWPYFVDLIASVDEG